MKKRLRVYNTGNANNIDVTISEKEQSSFSDIEPLFVMKVNDIITVEGCIKNLARKYQYKKNKEVYNIDFDFLRKLCVKCKNFIKQLEKEFANDMKNTKTKLKMIKNNKNDKTNNKTSYYMVIDKN